MNKKNLTPAVMDGKNMMTDFIGELYDEGKYVEQIGYEGYVRCVGFCDQQWMTPMVVDYNPEDNYLSIRLDNPFEEAILRMKKMVETNLPASNEGLTVETLPSFAPDRFISFRFWFD